MKQSQTEKIAKILTEKGFIDNYWAVETKLTYRLGARIFDLRARGWIINSEYHKDENTVYRLIRRPVGKQLTLV